MLSSAIYGVLNKVLDITGEVDCNLVDNCRLELMVDKISCEDFVQKTKHFILEEDILSYNEKDSKFVLKVTMNLTEDFINKVIAYAKQYCLEEFEEMKEVK